MVRRALPLLAAALLMACGLFEPATLADAELGTYTLRTINGAGLPTFLRADEGEPVTITAGALTLGADRKFVRSLSGHATGVRAITTVTEVGTYTVTRNRLTLIFTPPDCDCHVLATYANGTVTTGGDEIMVYTR
jgi:hypothetical protein